MTDREIMEQALEALETADESAFWVKQESVVKALRERLAQPEHKPMHPTLQKMWEDYFDKCYKRKPEQEPVAWADEIIDDLHSQYNTDGIKEIDSGDALIRLDEAIAAVEEAEKRHTAPQPEQEPVAWEDVLGAIARGWTHDDNKHKTMDVRLAVAIAKEIQDMVIAPLQRKPLTDEHIDSRAEQSDSYASFHAGVRFAEAAHGIKEKT